MKLTTLNESVSKQTILKGKKPTVKLRGFLINEELVLNPIEKLHSHLHHVLELIVAIEDNPNFYKQRKEVYQSLKNFIADMFTKEEALKK